jgi:hypothetical protein
LIAIVGHLAATLQHLYRVQSAFRPDMLDEPAGPQDSAADVSAVLNQADRLVGGKDAVLVIDDTSLPKKGERSVGVATSICVGSRQDGKLPNAGVFDACARRSASDDRVTSLSA